MSLIASPTPKAKLFAFAPLHHHSIKQAKPSSQTIIQKHQDSLHYATTIRNTNYSLIHGVFTRKKGNNKRVWTIFSAASIPVPGNEKDSSFGRILLSDVVVKRRKNIYWGRKWNSLDVSTVGVVVAMHLQCIAAPFTFNWRAFSVAVGLYVISGLLGITLSFHRNLSHRSFKHPKWLKYFLDKDKNNVGDV